MVHSISILGSTGSIGRQTVAVAEHLGLNVRALTTNRNIQLAEEQARIEAEATTIPQRETLNIVPPAYVAKGDRVALRYWTQVLDRLAAANVELLDNLDSEVLGLYCSMLSRRDRTCKMYKKLASLTRTKGLDVAELLDLTAQMQPLEELPVFPQAERTPQTATVSSLRLDAVLAAMLRCSRGMAAELVTAGRVEINHLPAESVHAPVYEDDVFTVRGKGRFQLTALPGKSKKDRLIIEYFQY